MARPVSSDRRVGGCRLVLGKVGDRAVQAVGLDVDAIGVRATCFDGVAEEQPAESPLAGHSTRVVGGDFFGAHEQRDPWRTGWRGEILVKHHHELDHFAHAVVVAAVRRRADDRDLDGCRADAVNFVVCLRPQSGVRDVGCVVGAVFDRVAVQAERIGTDADAVGVEVAVDDGVLVCRFRTGVAVEGGCAFTLGTTADLDHERGAAACDCDQFIERDGDLDGVVSAIRAVGLVEARVGCDRDGINARRRGVDLVERIDSVVDDGNVIQVGRIADEVLDGRAADVAQGIRIDADAVGIRVTGRDGVFKPHRVHAAGGVKVLNVVRILDVLGLLGRSPDGQPDPWRPGDHDEFVEVDVHLHGLVDAIGVVRRRLAVDKHVRDRRRNAVHFLIGERRHHGQQENSGRPVSGGGDDGAAVETEGVGVDVDAVGIDIAGNDLVAARECRADIAGCAVGHSVHAVDAVKIECQLGRALGHSHGL